MKLAQFKALIDDDDTFKNFLKEQEVELIDNLLEYCDNKKNSVCTNNAVAACDILCMGDAMTDLVWTSTPGYPIHLQWMGMADIDQFHFVYHLDLRHLHHGLSPGR